MNTATAHPTEADIQAYIQVSAFTHARRAWVTFVNANGGWDHLDSAIERLTFMLIDPEDMVTLDPERTWPTPTAEQVAKALRVEPTPKNLADTGLAVDMFGERPKNPAPFPLTAEWAPVWIYWLGHIVRHASRFLSGWTQPEPLADFVPGSLDRDLWDTPEAARYTRALMDVYRRVREHGAESLLNAPEPEPVVEEDQQQEFDWPVDEPATVSVVNQPTPEPLVEGQVLARHHAIHLLKAGHSLTLSAQVVRTMTAVGDWPEGLGLRSWAKRGLGRPGGITGMRYDFAALREEQEGWSQARPDIPAVRADGSASKYLDAAKARLMVHPLMAERHRAGTARKLRLVEGTNQYLCAVHLYADDDDQVVVGLPSCTGWCHEGWKPVADLMEALRPANIVEVLITLDADSATNRNVNEAGRRLARHCRMEGKKARHVRLDQVSGGGKEKNKDGLDDLVGRIYRRDEFIDFEATVEAKDRTEATG